MLKNKLQELSKEELIELLERFAPHVEDKDLPVKEESEKIPISVFNNKELSALETICKYLKENKHYTFRRIAEILNRNDRTIWTTYNNAKKKLSAEFTTTYSEINIPLDIFKERKLSVLESIAVYLKDELGLTLHEIAIKLNRNDRTIWTVYTRGVKKKK